MLDHRPACVGGEFGRLLRPAVPLWLFVALLVTGACSPRQQAVAPLAEAGQLDLRQWDFAAQGPVRLRGEWQFFWQRLVPPQEPFSAPPNTATAAVPGVWNGRLFAGSKLPAEGYASYRLRVLLPPGADRDFAIRIKHFDTSHRLFANGRVISQEGEPGTNDREAKPGRNPGVFRVDASGSQLVLLAHVSNFDHRNGGFPRPLELGIESELRDRRQALLALDLLLIGSLLIMGLYHLGLYSLRSKDLLPLYFGLFCLAVAARSLVVGERFLNDAFPEAPWAFYHRIEYFAFYVSVPLFMAYLRALYRDLFPRPALWIVVGIGALCSLSVLVLPSALYTRTVQFYQAFTVLCGLAVLVVVSIAVARKLIGAKTLLAGFLFFFATVINDILYAQLYLQAGFFVHLGVFVFFFSQAHLLARRFTGAFVHSEQLAVKLANSERRYRQLIENSGDIIVSLGDDGTMLTVSQAARELLAFRPQALVGRKLQSLVYQRLQSGVFPGGRLLEERLRHVLRKKSRSDFFVEFANRLGEPVELQVLLEYVQLEASHAVFGRLVRRAEDALLKYTLREERSYEIGNHFAHAELVAQRVSGALVRYVPADELVWMRLGLREILINAIEHGNLGITFEEKSAALEAGRLEELIRERRADPRLGGRIVHIDYSLDSERAAYRVRDQGVGFDHAAMLERARRQSQSPELIGHGRGLIMAMRYFDSIEYNEAGNEVLLTKTFG